MPQHYPCPKCNAVLKRDEPLEAGKKIRCPKCKEVFAPVAAKSAAVGKSDEDDRNPYAVVEDKADDEAMKAEKERAAYGLVKDRYKKSKRGPALKEVVHPSNLLLASGVINCIVALILFVIGIGTLVFWDFFYVEVGGQAPAGMKYSEWEAELKRKGGKVMSDEQKTNKILERCGIAGIGGFYFLTGSLMCIGAFKMRSLESHAWAMVGAITCLLFGIAFGLFIGIWNIVVLSNQVVKDGFAEEKPPEV